MFTIQTMAEALKLSRRRAFKGVTERDIAKQNAIGDRPVTGDPDRLREAQAQAERLVEEAVWVDNRLARRAQWVRRDEGEHCCADLVASGDDQPFYKHHRAIVNDATNAGEPQRIVISTDDKVVPEGTAAAFIATARLVQQFMPLEIWWQGSWLTQNRQRGYVFHVPLVKGDMDFSRLEFCIADENRDKFSFNVMITHAVLDVGQGNDGCGERATYSYLKSDSEVADRFVSHNGIDPTPESVANTAAQWLGWRPQYCAAWDADSAASAATQNLPPPPSPERTAARQKGEGAADQKRWEEAQRKHEVERQQAIADRMASVH